MMYTAYYKSPLGLIEIQTTDQAVSAITFPTYELSGSKSEENHPIVRQTITQLDEYFRGKRKKFTLPLALQGTDFQKRVWEKVNAIPYGETSSYRDIATQLHNEKASRAVGNANRKNRLLIVISCHRVVGSNGQLTGYAGDLWRKEWLLNHERL